MKNNFGIFFCLFVFNACTAISSKKNMNSDSPLAYKGSIKSQDQKKQKETPASEEAMNNLLEENVLLPLNRDFSSGRYQGDYHPQNCHAYFPWRGRPLGMVTVYGSSPEGSTYLWNSVLRTRLMEVKNAPHLHPPLTDLVNNHHHEFEEILKRGSIVAVNPADISKDLWYDIYALCGFVTKKVTLDTGSYDRLGEVLQGVFGKNDFSYFSGNDAAFVKSKVNALRSTILRMIGTKIRLQFLDDQSQNTLSGASDEKIYVNELEDLSGPIYEFVIIDVYTFYDMSRSMGLFKHLSPDNPHIHYNSTFVSDMHTVWLMNNLGIMYSTTTKYADLERRAVAVPYSLNSQAFTRNQNWVFAPDSQKAKFVLAENRLRAVLPPAVIRMDATQPTHASVGSVESVPITASNLCSPYRYGRCYFWTCAPDHNVYRCDINHQKQMWSCTAGCAAQKPGENDFCKGVSESEKQEKFLFSDGTVADKTSCQ